MRWAGRGRRHLQVYLYSYLSRLPCVYVHGLLFLYYFALYCLCSDPVCLVPLSLVAMVIHCFIEQCLTCYSSSYVFIPSLIIFVLFWSFVLVIVSDGSWCLLNNNNNNNLLLFKFIKCEFIVLLCQASLFGLSRQASMWQNTRPSKRKVWKL